ncbi:MAG: carboxypeptidase-like regulatory domain-containing protein [Bacteroidia bacterium]|nr:carboxypeptidase-like regulatory domain-containing protein [Bacteroidia bacterium]
MRKPFLLAVCLVWHCLSAQTLPGLITRQNSGNTPIPGVRVKGTLANSTESDATGWFTLKFAGKAPGYEVFLTVEKAGFEVVNREDLRATLNADPRRYVKLYLCPTGEWQSNAMQYYQINEKRINQKYDEKVAQIRSELAGNYKLMADSLKRLAEQVVFVRQQAQELSEQFARANLDDASVLYRQAYEFFIVGEIDSAIAVLQDHELDANMEAAQKEKRDAELMILIGQQKIRNAGRVGGLLAEAYELQASIAFGDQDLTTALAATDSALLLHSLLLEQDSTLHQQQRAYNLIQKTLILRSMGRQSEGPPLLDEALRLLRALPETRERQILIQIAETLKN